MATSPSLLLNVDDNEIARYARSRLFKHAGFGVREAATGQGALQLMKEGPDLVVLDVGLPDIDGFDVCRRIKSDELTAGTPVLQVSATFVKESDRARALAGGADGFLIEPIEPEVLVETVHAILRAHRRHRDLQLPPDPAPPVLPPVVVDSGSVLRGLRVLFIDDSDDTLELGVHVLGRQGAVVRAAGSSREALTLIAAWRPDVLIADIGMPGEDGYSFIRKLRALPAAQGGAIPAIAWTGYATDKDRRRSLDAGFQLHVSKPTTMDQLVQAITDVARRR